MSSVIRKKFSDEQKKTILDKIKDRVKNGEMIKDQFENHGINASDYYRWSKLFGDHHDKKNDVKIVTYTGEKRGPKPKMEKRQANTSRLATLIMGTPEQLAEFVRATT